MNLEDKVWDSVIGTVQASVVNSVWTPVYNTVWHAFEYSVYDFVWGSVRVPAHPTKRAIDSELKEYEFGN